MRDELRFDAAHEGRVSAGVRREIFDKDFSDPLGYGSTAYKTAQGLNAWELQASYMPVAGLTVYGKAGQSYRVANSDENALTPVPNEALKPQQSHDLELGASYATAAQKVTARVFRHNLTNEIFYDPTIFTNTNLAPTRREGFELDAEQRIGADWNVSAHYQHVDAKFTAGANSGKQMVLVPENTLTARLSWNSADGPDRRHRRAVGRQPALWLGLRQHLLRQDPRPTPRSTRAMHRKFGPWELALAGSNLSDKHYYSQAFTCDAKGKSGIYPSDGRQLKVSVRYEF